VIGECAWSVAGGSSVGVHKGVDGSGLSERGRQREMD